MIFMNPMFAPISITAQYIYCCFPLLTCTKNAAAHLPLLDSTLSYSALILTPSSYTPTSYLKSFRVQPLDLKID